MSVNIRKKIPYTELNYDYFKKGIDVSAMSFHKMLSVAKKLDAINEWGSVVALLIWLHNGLIHFIPTWPILKRCLNQLPEALDIIMDLTRKSGLIPCLNLQRKLQLVPALKALAIFMILQMRSLLWEMLMLNHAQTIVSLYSLTYQYGYHAESFPRWGIFFNRS